MFTFYPSDMQSVTFLEHCMEAMFPVELMIHALLGETGSQLLEKSARQFQ